MEKVKKYGAIVSISGKNASICIKNPDGCPEGCGGCSLKGGFLDSSKKEPLIIANNEINANVGQIVEISIRDRTLSGYAFVLFIFPLLVIFLGALAGYYISDLFKSYNVLFPVVGSVIGFLCSIFVIKIIDKKSKNSFTITKIIS
jgi:sigma-E factor negative regulatory protein RseC